MKKKTNEIWVGLFVVIGILLLVLLTLRVENFRIGEKTGYHLNVYFDSAGGLTPNSQVRVAGVHAGDVEKVTLENGKAKVTFHLPFQVPVYQDARAYLKSEGFLGEKHIELNPGTPQYAKVDPNGVIQQGAPPADMEQFLANMSGFREDVREVTKPLAAVLRSIDPKKVEGILTNVDKFSGQLTSIGSDSKEIIQKVKRGEGTLGKLINDETMYQDARAALEDVKGTAASLKNVSEKIEKGEGTLGKLIQDDSLYLDAKDTVHSMKEIAGKVEKGEGTLGKLVNDDTLAKEAEKTMKEIRRAAEGLEEQTPITVLSAIAGLFF